MTFQQRPKGGKKNLHMMFPIKEQVGRGSMTVVCLACLRTSPEANWLGEQGEKQCTHCQDFGLYVMK